MRVREALSYLFDFDWVNRNLYFGQLTRSDSYFAGSDLAFSVETHTAQRMTIRFGGPNPTGGGYYVRRDGDPHVYIVVNQVFDEIRSLLAGTEITRPDDPRVEKVLADDARNEDPEEVTNPWLGQVIGASH